VAINKSNQDQADIRQSATNARKIMPGWHGFCASFGQGRDLDKQTWYALPVPLIKEMQSEAADMLTADDWQFELALAELSHKFFAVGFASGRPIRYQLLVHSDPLKLTEDIVRAMGWHWSTHKADQLLEKGHSSASPFYSQQMAFAGWLSTHPPFLGEVRKSMTGNSQLPEQVDALGSKDVQSSDVRQLCSKWHLKELTTWELPYPQGPNISSVPFPDSLIVADNDALLHIPATMSVPARNNLRELITDIRRSETPPHLAEWQAILNRKSDQGLGSRRFAEMLPLHFYRNIVLGGRYPDRIAGHNQAIDYAFARWSNTSKDSIEDLRHIIERRLKPVA